MPHFKAVNTNNFSPWGICTLEMFCCARSTNDRSQKICLHTALAEWVVGHMTHSRLPLSTAY